jgi:hypothetical protein
MTPLMLSRARLAEWADDRVIRLTAAVAIVLIHIAIITWAGHDRLGISFNSHPGEAPYYSNPDAISLYWGPRQPHYWSRLVVSRWDSQHYIGFALRGLTACPPDGAHAHDYQYMQCGAGWLPAYGLLGGAIADTLHAPPDYTLFLLSCVFAVLFNFLLTSRTIAERLGQGGAWALLVAYNCYPSAFYLVTPYTEAATFACVIGAYLLMTRGRWLTAGALIGAATGLRVSAGAFSVGFGLAALLVAWRQRKQGTPQWWRPIAGASLAGWGLIATFIAYKIFLNEPFAYLRARAAFGDTHDFARLFKGTFYLKGFTGQHLDSVMLVGLACVVVVTARELYRRLPLEELVYLATASIVTVILSVGAVHEYWGLNRYLLACPIAFFGLGVIGRERPALFVLWLILCAALYWHVELCSFLAHGQPQYCPCLGRVEFDLPFDFKP